MIQALIGPLVLGLLLIYYYYTKGQQSAELQQAYAKYQGLLKKLKADPTNADLRQQSLESGRNYSNLTRKKKGVTIYDEVALMNDIGAATAGASVLVPQTQSKQLQSVEERLKKLQSLWWNGLITEQEFVSRKKQIIEEI